MDLLEQQLLTKAQSTDFNVIKLLGVGQHGMVVQAKCQRLGIPNPNKTYAVKLLFNFTHEYSSVMSNQYENEWLILSRLLPHPNIIRYWCQFISPVPESFLPHMPEAVREQVHKRNSKGEKVCRRGQFLVLDSHPNTLDVWLKQNPKLQSMRMILKFSCQLLDAVNYLYKQHICHLDLKLGNILVSKTNDVVLCDFGCAVQFPDYSFNLKWHHGMSVGGNRAHLSPEVLSQYHICRQNPRSQGFINYKYQSSFALGVIIHEIITGCHPLEDYPIAYMENGLVSYIPTDITVLPSLYHSQLSDLTNGLLHPDVSQRMDLLKAIDVVRKLQEEHGGGTRDRVMKIEDELKKIREERDLAEARLRVLASERDLAVREMKTMAEQCQEVAIEFEQLAKQCDSVTKQLKESKLERDAAVKASEGAFEAYEILKEQLQLVLRERDLARSQVEELRDLCSTLQIDNEIKECSHCQGFYLETDNGEEKCCWHQGRWSCCYKTEQKSEGCRRSPHTT